MQSYTHFNLTERNRLAQMRAEGMTMCRIAAELGRNPSSISRELRRNQSQNTGYNAWYATMQYMKRRKACRRTSRILKDNPLQAFVRDKLERYWPPETIVAIWKREHPGAKLGHSTIYRALKMGWLEGRSARAHLRRRGKRKYARRGRFHTIHPDYTIHDRPVQALERSRVGDWEGDCIVSGPKGKGKLFTCVDRASRRLVARQSDHGDAASIRDVMIDALASYPVHTLTLDNGPEFAKHRQIAEKLGTRIYFADPHAPWQRGSSENSNGLVRFFFPKATDFSKVDPQEIQLAVDLLNDRPRKCLGWLSPNQVFFSKCCT